MSTVSRETYAREAIRLAVESVEAGGGPFGAVVVKDGRVLARAGNRVTLDNDPTAHAEIVAIREACASLGSFQLDGCEVYCSSEPCPMCLGALYWARPAAVYYANDRAAALAAGFDDHEIYEDLCLPREERRYPLTRIEIPDAEAAFRRWSRKADRIEY